ncbi:MAG TPA: glycine zipper 2TM domain-containing protein [Burkholderiales bacterium]|nr:glycine zipper 2TM domain-containing protein [Burkholderiales bacterium]
METTGTVGRRSGLLYPAMVVAAIAVTVFSVAGIATMMGWLPSAQSRDGEPPKAQGAGGAGAVPGAKSGASRPRALASATCPECGVIEAIRAVEVKGQASGLGAVIGGVTGGVLGNQVGGGSGRTAMTVIGAGAGAYAGHEIEKSMNRAVRYQVRVRMNDGTYRTFYEAAPPAWSVGQRVRVTESGIVAAG